MSRWHPREWIEWIPERFNDAISFRNMRRFAQQELDRNAAIRAEIVDHVGEQAAVDEWDSTFERDNERCREAIAMIDARMEALGLSL